MWLLLWLWLFFVVVVVRDVPQGNDATIRGGERSVAMLRDRRSTAHALGLFDSRAVRVPCHHTRDPPPAAHQPPLMPSPSPPPNTGRTFLLGHPLPATDTAAPRARRLGPRLAAHTTPAAAAPARGRLRAGAAHSAARLERRKARERDVRRVQPHHRGVGGGRGNDAHHHARRCRFRRNRRQRRSRRQPLGRGAASDSSARTCDRRQSFAARSRRTSSGVFDAPPCRRPLSDGGRKRGGWRGGRATAMLLRVAPLRRRRESLGGTHGRVRCALHEHPRAGRSGERV